MTQLRPLLVLAAIILAYGRGPSGASIGVLLLVCNELVALRLRVSEPGSSLRRPTWLRWPWHRFRRPRFPTFDSVAADVTWSTRSARDFDLYARRRFQRVARLRLAERGLDLDRLAEDPEHARVVVGSELWHVVDPRRPASSDRDGGGIGAARMHLLLDALDALERPIGETPQVSTPRPAPAPVPAPPSTPAPATGLGIG